MQAKDVMHRGVISVLIDTTAEEIAKLVSNTTFRAFLS